MTYKEINVVNDLTISDLLSVVKHNAVWKDVKGETMDFKTWSNVDKYIAHISELNHLWPVSRWERAFFLCIPPKGNVHRHTDTKRDSKTYHIPIKTNDKCISYMYDPDESAYHLKVGMVYSVDRNIEHGSINQGKTDRVHLLMEIL